MYWEKEIETLDRQAMPVIRYRTRDLTRFLPGECKCGRTHRRLVRIAGRSDDMFIMKCLFVRLSNLSSRCQLYRCLWESCK